MSAISQTIYSDAFSGMKNFVFWFTDVLCCSRPNFTTPQCTRPKSQMHQPISHNVPSCNRNINVCLFLLQNDALWDICVVHCGICEMDLYILTWHDGSESSQKWGVMRGFSVSKISQIQYEYEIHRNWHTMVHACFKQSRPLGFAVLPPGI